VARIGGDEFGVLFRGMPLDDATPFVEALVTHLEDEFTVEGHAVRVSACAGLSTEAGEDVDVEELLAQAQFALHEAKLTGTGIVRSFTGVTGERSQVRLRLRAEIKEELRLGGEAFVPYYQPIVDLADGSVLAVESLVRWDVDGLVRQPDQFIGEIERSGSMPALTAHMLVASLRELRNAGIDAAVTVNIPPDLVDADLGRIVGEALVVTGSKPEQLIVEVTEDAILRNPEHAALILGQLRHFGVRVLLDDFGTGWSGLSSLRDLVVDGLKIDGSFTRAMQTDGTTDTIVRSVAELAARLNVLVIYEGVEDQAQLAQLRGSCDGFVQGFAVSRPMPVADLVRWFHRRARSVPEAMAESVTEPVLEERAGTD